MPLPLGRTAIPTDILVASPLRRNCMDALAESFTLHKLYEAADPAAVLAERAITEFDPAAVFFVGVAGSLSVIQDVGPRTLVYSSSSF